MLPAIQDGDILHVQPEEPGNFRAGDIVLFKRGEHFKAHRILRREGECFVTRGDTGMQIDGTIHTGQILGRVVAKQSRQDGRVVRLDSISQRIRFMGGQVRRAMARRLRVSFCGIAVLCLGILFGSVSAHAQLSVDHSATVQQALLSGPAGSFTLTAVPINISGTANLLIVGVSFNNTGNTGSKVTGITYGSQTFNSANSFTFEPANNQRVEIWYLTSPASGTNNVVVTVNKSGGNGNKLGVQVGAISFIGADTTSPIRGFTTASSSSGTSTASSVTVTSASPEIVLDVLSTLGTVTATAGSGQTQQWNQASSGTPNSQLVLGFGSTKAGAASVTMSETLSSGANWTVGAVSVRPREADLAITKTAPATVITGANFNYTLSITNNGPRTATNVIVSDTIPSGVTFVSVAPSSGICSFTSPLLTCSLGDLTNGATATVTITVKAGSPGQVTNTGSVSSAVIDPDSTNNSSSVTTAIAFPNAATITEFSAAQASGGVVLSWRSGGELHNLGYNVYRDSGGDKVRLNPSLIAGSALLMRNALEQHGAKSYKWIDAAANSAAVYWVEDVDLNGTRTMHGPVSVQQSTLAAPAQAQTQAATIQDLNARTRTASASSGFAASAGTARVRETLARPMSASTTSNIGFELAARPGVKIFVDHEGWYRVTQPQLVAAGMDRNAESSTLHLYAEGVEQPIRVTPAQGRFGPQSTIEFYGTAIDTPFSGQRVYWLTSSAQPGLKIAEIAAGSSGPQAQTFIQTLELKPRTTYFATYMPEDSDNFFGPLISPTPESQTLAVANLAPGEGKFSIQLQGVTLPQTHDVSVMLNGATLGEVTFTGQQKGHGEFPIPPGVLTNGSNTITLTAQQGDNDLSLVDTIEISFPHTFTAESDFLKFTAEAGESVNVGGFAQRPTQLVDITDVLHPVALEHSESVQNGTYSLQASIPWTTPGQHTLMALSDAQASTPVGLAAHHPSALHSAQAGAELVILTAPQFANQLLPLAALHRSQGQSVALVTVDSVYDEFNFGERTPFAIRNFLKTATEAWKEKPHFLVLAGDASLDPKNYLGFGDFDFVPTRFLPTAELKTASDDWFSDFGNTGLAKIATGRLPARTEADAKLMVGKIVSYAGTAPDTWTTQALMAADRDDPTVSFTQASQSVQKLLPPTVTASDVFATTLGIPAARQNLIDGINAGQLLVNYNGHGSVQIWSGSDLFDDTAAFSLTNGQKLPMFVIMNCLNGFFQDVSAQSLAESLMLAPNGGAVAVWASSGLTVPDPQFLMNQKFVQALFSSPAPAIGDAALAAKSAITDLDVRKTFILFGDPAMHLLGSSPSSDTGAPARTMLSPQSSKREAGLPQGAVRKSSNSR